MYKNFKSNKYISYITDSDNTALDIDLEFEISLRFLTAQRLRVEQLPIPTLWNLNC